jgi:LPS sulfotransferase NodH
MAEIVLKPSRGYMLCSLPRTGSSLLANALIDGSAGRPREYFSPILQNGPMMREILGDANIIDGLDKILEAGTSPNGVFGVRVHWPAFRHLGLRMRGQWSEEQRTAAYDLLRAELPEDPSLPASLDLLRDRFAGENWQDEAYALLNARIPDLRFIWLRRRNMVARAVSEVRALRSGRWYMPKQSAAESASAPEPEFDFTEIHIRYCMGLFFEEQWRRFFARFQIPFHSVIFEELAVGYEATARRALAFLNVGGADTAIAPPQSEKQSDILSEMWEARYRALIAEAETDRPKDEEKGPAVSG